MIGLFYWPLDSGSSPGDSARDGDHQAGPNEGNQDAGDVQTVDVQAEQITRQEAPHDGPNDPQHNVSDDPVAAAFHDLTSQKTGDQTQNDPGNNTHDNALRGHIGVTVGCSR